MDGLCFSNGLPTLFISKEILNVPFTALSRIQLPRSTPLAESLDSTVGLLSVTGACAVPSSSWISRKTLLVSYCTRLPLNKGIDIRLRRVA